METVANLFCQFMYFRLCGLVTSCSDECATAVETLRIIHPVRAREYVLQALVCLSVCLSVCLTVCVSVCDHDN